MVDGVVFDPTDRLIRGAGLTGAVDSSTGTISFWIKRNDTGTTAINLVVNNPDYFFGILMNAAAKLEFYMGANAYADGYGFTSTATFTGPFGWRHVLASWDTNFSVGNKLVHLYVNDVSAFNAVAFDDGVAFNIDYTESDWGIATDPAAAFGELDGELAEFWFAPGQFLDFSVAANRRKFITSAVAAVNLGSDGSLPTGTAPLVYLKGPASSFPTNAGTGGGMTLTGTLTDSSADPLSVNYAAINNYYRAVGGIR